jgi:prephenate dehydratase
MTSMVVYQGEPGAYSDEAAQLLFPGSTTRGLATFQDVFSELDSGRALAAVLPVENSLAGVVQEVSDLLWLHSGLTAVAEHVAPIRHHLLGREGAPVTRALSHPQALAQCAGWLREHDITPVSFHDTAGAAREVAERGAPGDGAIASRLAADRYGLVVLASELADDASNRTRFLVIERNQGSSPTLSGPAKFSLGFVAEHRPGGLARVLEVFARNGMNLTRLDSRPIPHQPFHYRFYADVELLDAGQYSSLIRELRDVTSELRPFGIYHPGQVAA